MQNVKNGEYIKIVSQRGIMEATILQLCNKFGANDKFNVKKKMLMIFVNFVLKYRIDWKVYNIFINCLKSFLIYFLLKKFISGSAEWLPVLVECFHFIKFVYSKPETVPHVLCVYLALISKYTNEIIYILNTNIYNTMLLCSYFCIENSNFLEDFAYFVFCFLEHRFANFC